LAAATKYVNNLDHSLDLADGRTIGAGEEIALPAEQAKEDHNATLISDGSLVKAADLEKEEPAPPAPDNPDAQEVKSK
jgi:hypothetical protein